MNTIDKILYINLNHRTDRKKNLLKNLKEMNIDMNKVYRVDAVLNKICGHLGCALSHINAIEYAIENSFENIMILEDDFKFTMSKEYINNNLKIMFENNNWNVILLTHGHIGEKKDINIQNFRRVFGVTTASGYIVKKSFYKILLENYKKCVVKLKVEVENHINKCKIKGINVTKLVYCTAIDQYWFSLQNKYNFYMFEPIVGRQTGEWSDNNNSIEFQEKFLKEKEKEKE